MIKYNNLCPKCEKYTACVLYDYDSCVAYTHCYLCRNDIIIEKEVKEDDSKSE